MWVCQSDGSLRYLSQRPRSKYQKAAHITCANYHHARAHAYLGQVVDGRIIERIPTQTEHSERFIDTHRLDKRRQLPNLVARQVQLLQLRRRRKAQTKGRNACRRVRPMFRKPEKKHQGSTGHARKSFKETNTASRISKKSRTVPRNIKNASK
jgi:hypothetical protein